LRARVFEPRHCRTMSWQPMPTALARVVPKVTLSDP
jgi:hypothetical protein